LVGCTNINNIAANQDSFEACRQNLFVLISFDGVVFCFVLISFSALIAKHLIEGETGDLDRDKYR